MALPVIGGRSHNVEPLIWYLFMADIDTRALERKLKWVSAALRILPCSTRGRGAGDLSEAHAVFSGQPKQDLDLS